MNEINKYLFDMVLNRNAIPCAMHYDTDPVTGENRVTLFTDDGHGNGECIFSTTIGALSTACENEVES